MLEIFSHDLSVRGDDDAEGVLIISGKDWENEPFNLYVNEEGAKTLLWQLSFFQDRSQIYYCDFCGEAPGGCDCGVESM